MHDFVGDNFLARNAGQGPRLRSPTSRSGQCYKQLIRVKGASRNSATSAPFKKPRFLEEIPYASDLRATRIMAAALFSTSSSVVAHEHKLIRIAVCFCHTVPPHQQVPSCWIPCITR